MSPINSSISHSFATATTFPKIATNGLLAYFDAGQQNSYIGTGTIWKDLSGNGTNGTLTNGPTFSSANGGVIAFDGTDDKVIASNANLFHRTGNWTYSFTVLFSGFTIGSGNPLFVGIFESGSTSSDYFLMRFQNFGGGSANIRILSKYSSTTADAQFSFIPTIDVWYHLTFVRNGSSVDFYINGVFSSTKTWNGDVNPSTSFIYFANEQQDNRPWKGRWANFIIYNRALTTQEIQQNFDSIRGRFGI